MQHKGAKKYLYNATLNELFHPNVEATRNILDVKKLGERAEPFDGQSERTT
jgi:hypothetical protein